MVEKPLPARSHRRAGKHGRAADDHPRGHALGMGVDRMQDACRAHRYLSPAAIAASVARTTTACCSGVSS